MDIIKLIRANIRYKKGSFRGIMILMMMGSDNHIRRHGRWIRRWRRQPLIPLVSLQGPHAIAEIGVDQQPISPAVLYGKARLAQKEQAGLWIWCGA